MLPLKSCCHIDGCFEALARKFAYSIEAKVAAAREKTEKLRQSILAKAFSGELVPTEAEIARREGKDYDMAEVLLEMIKTERRVGKSNKLDTIFKFNLLLFSFFGKSRPPLSAGECPGT